MSINPNKPIQTLSVKQPWASMIVSGQKTIETRSWQTSYRGPILICSGLKADPKLKKEAEGLPLGQALGIVYLLNCRDMNPKDELEACCEAYKGARAWILAPIVHKIPPFSLKGQLGLFYTFFPENVKPFIEAINIRHYDNIDSQKKDR